MVPEDHVGAAGPRMRALPSGRQVHFTEHRCLDHIAKPTLGTMYRSSVIVFVLSILGHYVSGLLVQPEWQIYYDLRTNKTIGTIDTSNPRHQIYRQSKSLRIGFGPIPCSCQSFTCGCCTGMNIETLNFNHRACMNFTYDPSEFAINMDMLMDDESLLSQSISGKNPPPLCMPAPFPPIFPSIDFCFRFFNIHTQGYNIFTCLDFETRLQRAPILVLHFDCLEMGQDGISHHKPDDFDYAPGEGSVTGQDDEQIEIYDEVVEDTNTTIIVENTNTSSTTTTSPPPNKSIMKADGDKNPGEMRKKEIYDEVSEDGTRTVAESEASENFATTEGSTKPL